MHGNSSRSMAGCLPSSPLSHSLPPATSLHSSSQSRSTPEDSCNEFRSCSMGLSWPKHVGWPAQAPTASIVQPGLVLLMAESPIERPQPPHDFSLQTSPGLFPSPKVFGVGGLLTPDFVLSARLKLFPSRLLMPHYLPLKERTTLLLL